MPKPKIPLMLRDTDLYELLCRHSTVTGRKKQDILADALREYLLPPKLQKQAKKPAKAQSTINPALMGDDPICRRSGCGHPQSKHWSRGCTAGCLCSEARFVEPL